ncbi:MAG: hypothetical protein ACYCXW_07955 [Solirubrobacteraceae bacterium]
MSISRLRRAFALAALCALGGASLGASSAAARVASDPLAPFNGARAQLLTCVTTNVINHVLCERTKTPHPRVIDVQGPRGPAGPQGLPGAQGAAGATGSTGAQGPVGPQGLAGDTGATGPAGPQGDTGPAAWTTVTAYSGTATYTSGPPASVVTENGSTYVCVSTAPCSGHDPGATTGYWTEVAAAGATGPAGPTGAKGDPGPQGPQGIQGPTGPAGCSVKSNGSCTEVVDGNKIGPVVAEGVSLTGSENYSVAECPSDHPEVYGGGGVIVKNGQNSGGDVVILDASYPGTYAGPGAEVTPITSGSAAANAYEAKAIVSYLAQGDNYTLQAYAICGP